MTRARRQLNWALLTAILLLGIVLRFIAPGLSPPGMSPEEASNVWRIMELGATHESVQSVRWAGAAAGVLALLAMFYVGMRLFGRATGLLAAALLAVMPWSLQLTRWGHASALIQVLTLAPLAAVLWAVPRGSEERRWYRVAIAAFACAGSIAMAVPRLHGPVLISQYLPHFGADFLLEKGDPSPLLSPPEGYGELLLFMVPMMIAGAVFLVKRWRTPAARLLAVWLLLYPLADLAGDHPSLMPSVMRSAPGLCALVLLAAWGTVETVTALGRSSRGAAWVLATVIGIGSAAMTFAYLRDFFGNFNREDRVFSAFHVDVVTAMDWLRPRFSQVDAVYLTEQGLPQASLYAAIGLRLEPQDMPSNKVRFLQGNAEQEVAMLMKSRPHGKVVLIARPGEVHLPGRQASVLITNGHHAPTLEIYQVAW